jgi:dienelactone hydrolase/predicted Ser/Thr protein kinase
MIGQTLGHYRIEAKLGEGGMGVVYRARDLHLDRPVAIKVLPPERTADAERKGRFVQEAKAASALNHPNIITIHDIDTAGGADYMVMEYVEGRSLDRLIASGPLPVDQALDYAVQLAAALAAAHAAGIVHRDIKPANIMVTEAGHVKVLDFGLAKLSEHLAGDPEASTRTAAALTKEGVVVGTVAYMSPEQALAKPVDARSDVFSLGSVLYELLAGRRPFQGDSNISTMMAIVHQPPAALKAARTDVPPQFERIVLRCLEKDPAARYPSSSELHSELVACQKRWAAQKRRSAIWRPRYLVPAFVLALLLCDAGWRLYQRSARRQWANREAIHEIRRLVDEQKFLDAFRVAEQAERYAPESPALLALWPRVSRTVTVRTTPPGADVYVREYASENAAWRHLGRSPIEGARMPLQYCRWRLVKEGFETIEVADRYPPYGTAASWPLEFQLAEAGLPLAGMRRVPAGQFGFRLAYFGLGRPLDLSGYWIDRFEVTNRQFKQFLDKGGYQNRAFWKNEFSRDGRVVSWEEGVRQFVDATGRPGPRTWALGTHTDGQQDFPVGGVSWYEAAAYCESAGKTLPTLFHWYQASGMQSPEYIIPLSNIGTRSLAAVGSHHGLSPYGPYDMAGNVREWCWNPTGNLRFILGGAWNDPAYMFWEPHARSPFDRSPENGFRCVRYDDPDAVSAGLSGLIEIYTRDYSREKPVSDEVLRIYMNLFSYDRSGLNAKVESVDESAEHWTLERITFDAAYGKERVPAYLFRPKSAQPPYQAVVYFPGATAEQIPSSANLYYGLGHIEPIIRSGRAVLYPIYQGTYERLVREGGREPTYANLDAPVLAGPSAYRDKVIMMAKDLFRSLDYLDTRQDIRMDRLAYMGNSLGSRLGVILMALENRFRTAVFLNGGLHLLPKRLRAPEVDEFSYGPRVKVPVLMVNGRHDYGFPMDRSQLVLFRLLGVPGRDKRHVVFDRGHSGPFLAHEEVREILDWLDRYLGPVKMK